MKIKASDLFSGRNWFTFGISFALATIMFFILFYCNEPNLYNAMDSTFITGLTFSLFSGLFFVTQEGVFDVFALGFSNLIHNIKRNENYNYVNLYEYRENKRLSRKSNIYLTFPILCTGLIYILVSIVLFIVWTNSH